MERSIITDNDLLELEKNEKIVYKSCDKYIIVLKLFDDSDTNEDRPNIVNKKYATYKSDKSEIMLIFNKFTKVCLNYCFHYYNENKIEYTVGDILCNDIYYKSHKVAFYDGN